MRCGDGSAHGSNDSFSLFGSTAVAHRQIPSCPTGLLCVVIIVETDEKRGEIFVVLFV